MHLEFYDISDLNIDINTSQSQMQQYAQSKLDFAVNLHQQRKTPDVLNQSKNNVLRQSEMSFKDNQNRFSTQKSELNNIVKKNNYMPNQNLKS